MEATVAVNKIDWPGCDVDGDEVNDVSVGLWLFICASVPRPLAMLSGGCTAVLATA